MSIKRNNKQIAGNYVNFDINLFNTQVNQMKQELIDLYNATKELISKVNGQVGQESIWRGLTPPENFVFMEGQLLSRVNYKSLYDWAVKNNLIVTDIDWNTNKKYGLYSQGDGSTTFRLPNMTGYYLAGYDNNSHSGLCIAQDDTLPNLKGSIDIAGTNDSSPTSTTKASGVFSVKSKTLPSYPITGSTTLTENNIESIELDISKGYNTSDRVQPKTIPVRYIVCYQDVRSNIENGLKYSL